MMMMMMMMTMVIIIIIIVNNKNHKDNFGIAKLFIRNERYCGLHRHTASGDVHLYSAVTPCYCSILGALGRVVGLSFRNP